MRLANKENVLMVNEVNFQKQPPVVFYKKLFLKISQNLQENNCARVSFVLKACNFIKKEALAQVFSWEFCEVFNIFFTQHP